MQEFLDALQKSIEQKTFVKLMLSNPLTKGDLKSVEVRLVKIQETFKLQFVSHYKTKDDTQNFEWLHAKTILENQLLKQWKQAALFTTNGNYQLLGNGKGNFKLITQKATHNNAPTTDHDRKKEQLIHPGEPWLQTLGISSASGMVYKEAQDKFRQINRYVEIIGHHLDTQLFHAGAKVRIIDVGAGKGYLTFALYAFLKQRGYIPEITGVELRPGLVESGNQLAAQMNFDQLNFIAADIRNYADQPFDMVIALHACDTATDEAIAFGIRNQTKMIVVAPCCQKQVRKQMQPKGAMAVHLKHGLVLEREAALLTDSLRAMIMEWKGYKTKVIEFIESEHTPKNLMITGVKSQPQPNMIEAIQQLKSLYGLNQHFLEKLLDPE